MTSDLVPFNGLPDIPMSFEKDGHRYELRGDRIVRDGTHVGVAYSPGYGAGWTTWDYDDKVSPLNPFVIVAILFDRVDAIVNASDDDKETYLGSRDMYMGGARYLTIAWVPIGTMFRVHEYDGYESVETLPNAGFQEA